MPDYEKVTVEELPDAPNPTSHKKEVDEAVGATEFGFNLYIAEPGQRFPWGYHHHPDHEELFYVLDGELEVETPDGVVEVGTGEALFVPPNAPNKAVAVGSGPVRVVAVGAPKDSDGAVIADECPACGEETARDYEAEGNEYVLSCAVCGEKVDRIVPGPD